MSRPEKGSGSDSTARDSMSHGAVPAEVLENFLYSRARRQDSAGLLDTSYSALPDYWNSVPAAEAMVPLPTPLAGNNADWADVAREVLWQLSDVKAKLNFAEQ